MTREEKLNILGAKLVEAYEAIRDMDITDERFHGVFHLAGEIEWKMDSIRHPEPDGFITPVTPKQDLDPAPEAKEPVKLDPFEEPAPVSKQSTMTKAEMVSKLTTFQTNGVAIDKVMESMGYTKLSQVPANQYDKLLDLCQEALDGEG